MRKKLVVVCPGRGSYGKEQLGTLSNRGSKVANLVKQFDQLRTLDGSVTVTELDNSPRFSAALHTIGENASILIHCCALADFTEFDWDSYECVAVIGNSMGWYTALAVASAVGTEGGYRLVNSMGSMMKNGLVGAQLIYPIVDLTTWEKSADLQELVRRVISEISQVPAAELHISIRLGGYLVLAGNESGVQLAMQKLPSIEGKYPFKLQNHGAFHTSLMGEISSRGKSLLSTQLFSPPKIPLIDGRGAIWRPTWSDPVELREYTLGHQVTETYDFSRSIEVALKEYAPDGLLLLGPGNSLGGAIGQTLVSLGWKGILNKDSFKKRQETAPFLITSARGPES